MAATPARKPTSKQTKPETPPKINKISGAQYLANIYKPLIIIMLVCGFNFGVTKIFVIKICLKIYAFFLIIIISYASMTCCKVEDVSFIWSLLEYSVFVAIMLFYRSKMAAYLNKIYLIDTYLRINHRYYYKFRNKQIAMILLIWIIRIIHTTVYCTAHSCYHSVELFYIYEFSLFALDVNRIWRYCHFEEIWKRLKLLRMRLQETPESNVYLYVKDNKMISENKVKFCFFLYRNIGELLDLISPELDASFFISVVCSLPKLILNVYRILLVIDKQLPYTFLGSMMMNLIQISIFIFLPCIVMEMCAVEVERIRLFLMHQLIKETDETAKEDLRFLLQYINLRPFSYKVCRLIPLDLTLPLTLINLCTTYVIVIVNFTKVFT